MTNHALLTKIMDKDSLFASADSMWAYQKKIKVLKDSTANDSIKTKTGWVKDTSLYKEADSTIIRAYHHVKIFKKEVQGIADTMIFSAYDSTLTLYHLPVLWHKENQLSGQRIIVYFKKNKIDRIQIPENTFIIALLDTLHFNQVKGKLLWAYFKNDTLRRIDITGNAQATYYLQNNKKKFQGVNTIESAKLSAVSRKGELNQITFLKQPKAKIFPMKGLDVKTVELKGFDWQVFRKPKSKEDLFKKDRKE